MMAIQPVCLRNVLVLLPALLISAAAYPDEDLCSSSDPLTAIHNIQGTGGVSPMEGDTVLVEGLVTKKVTKFSKDNNGLYLQMPQNKEDGDEATSEGIFVRLDPDDMEAVNENDLLRVEGVVIENYGETRISPVTKKQVCQAAGTHGLAVKERTLPDNTVLQQSQDGESSMERYEGMKVNFTGKIIRSYSYDYDASRNNLVLAREVQFKPTQLMRPGTEADNLNKANQESRIVLEEGDFKKNGDIGYYPQFNPDDYPLRIGSTVTDIPVVIGYGYKKYFMVAVGQWGDTTVSAPSEAPYKKEPTPSGRQPGQQRAAGVNLLNYFTDAGVEDAPKASDNRGAANTEDFYLQRLKITRAITAIDADLLGLLEVDNNGRGARSAIADLVETLNFNQADKDKHYQFVFPDTDRIGTDAISVGMIYRPKVFTATGNPVLLDMPKEQQGDQVIGQRDSMAQEFCRTDAVSICMTVVVNHFKSKRCSGCKDDPSDVNDNPPIQGCCTNLRVSASVRLGEYVKQLSDADKKVLLLGDFNAYGEENPIYLLTATDIAADENVKASSVADIPGLPGFNKSAVITKGYGLTSLVKEKHGKEGFSYSYGAELGSLDHALANEKLTPMITGAFDWHINSLESNLFEYSGKYTGKLPEDSTPSSYSDHDPVILDLNLQ